MSINTAVAFTLRDDNGTDQTLWLGFSEIEGIQGVLAGALAEGKDTRAETVANIVEHVLDELPNTAGLSFAQPPGITHTVHTFNFNDETVVLTDPETGTVKVTFPFARFIQRSA